MRKKYIIFLFVLVLVALFGAITDKVTMGEFLILCTLTNLGYIKLDRTL